MAKTKIVELVEKLLDERKAKDIVTIDVKKITPFADYYVIATTGNKRHLNALVEEIADKLEEQKFVVKNIEGNPESGWMLVDAQSVIINVFVEDVRKKYNLESLLNKKQK